LDTSADGSSALVAIGAGRVLRQQCGWLLTVAASSSRTAASCIGELTPPIRPGVSAQDAPAYVHRLRTEGVIFGVWSEPRRRYIHPDFQFDRDGRPIPDVARLLAILAPETRRLDRCTMSPRSSHCGALVVMLYALGGVSIVMTGG
jgi:hypothetical protein